MSVGTGGNSGKWKQNYEKILLVVVLAGLMASALYLFIMTETVKKELAAMDADTGPILKQAVEAVDEEQWLSRIAVVNDPFQKGNRANQLMVSELRLSCVNTECFKPIPDDAEVCPFCGAKQPKLGKAREVDDDMDGIPNAFELEHDLDPFDPSDADLDKDGDTFSNLEEFNVVENKWESNPSDKSDFPSPVAKLRLVRVKEKPFTLRFQGVQVLADGRRFLLNMRTAGQSHFVKIGDVVEGYEVVSYEEHVSTNSAYKLTDRSVLNLKKDGDSIPLIKNVDRTRQERTALLVLLIDRSRYEVKNDNVIDLKGRKYKVIDIRPDRVLIRDIQTRKESVANRLSESEKAGLRGVAPAVAPEASVAPQNSPGTDTDDGGNRAPVAGDGI